MLAPNRRWSVARNWCGKSRGRAVTGRPGRWNLSYREEQAKFLEGTGSLVLDRANRVAYAGLSPRTDLDVLGEFAQQLDYDLVTFEASDAAGKPCTTPMY